MRQANPNYSKLINVLTMLGKHLDLTQLPRTIGSLGVGR